MKPQSPALLEVTTKLAGFSTVSFLVYHHAARNGQLDNMSQYVQDFREGTEPLTSRWVTLAGELAGDAGTYDIVIRALGSGETSVKRGSPLDRLCEAIAQRSGCRYQPTRLTKTRKTRKLQGLGGHAAHQKELSGAYKFDGMGLRTDARILVVDDIVATGATLEAIASAIYETLPGSTLSGFVLSKAGSPTSAGSIDPDYFTSGTVAATSRGKSVMRSNGSAPEMKSKARTAKPAASRKAVPAPSQGSSAHRRTNSIMTVVGILLALAIVGAVVPFRPAAKERPTEISDEEFGSVIKVTDQAKPQPADPAPTHPVAAERKNLRPGIVTIPSVGLRTDHSVDARSIRKAVARLGEKVEILRRYAADSGPDWLQVQTKGGQVGWVMASTIAEPKRRD